MLNLVSKLGVDQISSRLKIPSGATKLLVLGNGMVGHHFLKQLVARGVNTQYEVTVIGDELIPAYNRIKLGEYVEHRSEEKLFLDDATWYSEHGIDLKLGQLATAINRDDKYVILENGDHEHYDLLVLATGSRPTIPNIEGTDAPHVLIYRNIADLKKIITKFESAQEIAVIGGGLLGIEAAHTFQNLGVKTTIIQRANFLMTRQLNTDAAASLQKQIEETGINVITKAQKTIIGSDGNGHFLTLNDQEKIRADYVS